MNPPSLRSCAKCQRHFRRDDTVCPFCGTSFEGPYRTSARPFQEVRPALAAAAIGLGVASTAAVAVVVGVRAHLPAPAPMATMYGGPPLPSPAYDRDLAVERCAQQRYGECDSLLDDAIERDFHMADDPIVRDTRVKLEAGCAAMKEEALRKCEAGQWEECETLLNRSRDGSLATDRDPRVISARAKIKAARVD